MFKKKEIWEKITVNLKSDISGSEFDLWLSQAVLKKLEPGWAEIEVSNKYVANWLKDNYITQIKRSFKKALKSQPEIYFTFRSPTNYHATPENFVQQKIAPFFNYYLNPLFSFSNYVEASNNRFAYSSALQVADKPVESYNPLYIYCELSSGKTHLLYAIANRVIANIPSLIVRYVPFEQFSSGFSIASKDGDLDRFREQYNSIDFILIDNIQFTAGNQQLQEELVLLFNSFYSSNRQIVVAGKSAPKKTHGINLDLSSRLGSGLICEINTPDQKTKTEIIVKKSKGKNLHIPDDVVFFLANSTNDLKTLVNYLAKFETYFSFYQRSIDMSIAKSIIKSGDVSDVDIHHIQRLTASYFGISLSDLLSKKKIRGFSYPRQIAMYLTRNLTGLSFKAIGEAFGNKDHSTVLYAVRQIEKKRGINNKVLKDINQLQGFIS